MNAFDEQFDIWLKRCYERTLDAMPEIQRKQLEAAFYSGAAFGGQVAAKHGHAPVLDAIVDHLQRAKGWVAQASSSPPPS